MEVLAKRIKWLREQRRLTQKEVAAEIGMSLNGLQKIEGNERNPKLEVLISIAKLFNVSTDFLLGLNDHSEKIKQLRTILNNIKRKIKEVSAERNMIVHDLHSFTGKSDGFESSKIREQQYEYITHHFHELELEYNQTLKDYIISYYGIPESTPENDEIIKDVLPLELEIDEFERGYRINLKSLKGLGFGVIAWYQSDNKEECKQKTIEANEKYREMFRLN